MARAPFQVLIIPYKFSELGISYCVFKRPESKNVPKMWQWVSGGGENSETKKEAAVREMKEETGISVINLIELTSQTHIPAIIFEEIAVNYPEVIVIPEYSFGVHTEETITLSDEHSEYIWTDYNTATQLLMWDSNKTALYELDTKLRLSLTKK